MTEKKTEVKQDPKKYNDEKRIVLFKNDKYEAGSDLPIIRGSITINGKLYYLSVWQKTDKNGKPYWQGKAQTPEEAQIGAVQQELPMAE